MCIARRLFAVKVQKLFHRISNGSRGHACDHATGEGEDRNLLCQFSHFETIARGFAVWPLVAGQPRSLNQKLNDSAYDRIYRRSYDYERDHREYCWNSQSDEDSLINQNNLHLADDRKTV